MFRLQHSTTALILALTLLAPGWCAAEGSWEPTALSRLVEKSLRADDPEAVFESLRAPETRILPYDLHDPRGALAVAALLDGGLVPEILERAGHDIRFDSEKGHFLLNGEPRAIWANFDLVSMALPTSTLRYSLPPRLGLISVDHAGKVRFSDGSSPAEGVRLGPELDRAVAGWVADKRILAWRLDA